MKTIDSYVTKNVNDDHKKGGLTSKLATIPKAQRGDVLVGAMAAVIAMPVCAYLGSYLGEGFGYLWGNLIDFIPYVNDVAPWLGQRAGLIQEGQSIVDLNENLYQTTGAIGGFWGGLWFPWKVLGAMAKHM